jgi:CheY-like chemotaxis protein
MSEILVIDDEASVRDLLQKALKIAGYETRAALNGQEGLAFLHKAPPDLIITDIFMPGKDGFSVIEEAHRRFPGIPIISITAGQGDDCARAREMGATRTFVKPIQITELLDAVNHLLHKA